MTHNKILKVMVAFVMMIILMFTSVVPTFAVSIGTQTYISTGESTGFSCTKDGSHYDFLFMKIRGTDDKYVYCAEPGAGWTETYYKVQAPKDDAYWKSLSKTKKEGMTLACMFGYPTQSAKVLGASTGKEAYAATQAIVWEYASGVRTKATGNPTNTAFRGALNKSALAAYNNILSQMNTYMNAPGYSADEMFKHNKLYMMSTATGYPEQAIILYIGDVPQIRGAIEIFKKDQDGSPLAGAEFKIYDSNGVVKQVLTTDRNGYAITEGGKDDESLDYGKYIVEETKAPEGYKISGVNRWVVEVGKANNGVVTIEVVNELKKGYIIIEKFDEDENPLEGAEFTVYDKEGKVVTVVGPTDEDGYAISEGGSQNPCVPYGTYTVKETKFPVGVEEKDVEWEFTLNDNHTVERHEVINNRIQWDLTLTKRVASGYTTSYPIEGAKYGLYKDGELIETLVIGENNKAHTKSYPAGTGYTIKEIEAPHGYRLDTTEYSLDELTSASYLLTQNDADGDGAYDIAKTVYDFPLGGCIYLRKKMQDKFNMSDFMASEEGAEFVVYNKRFSSYEAAVRFNAVSNYDSCVIDKGGTGVWQDGQRESRSLTMGTYIVHQTKAGKSGLILSEDFEVVIDREITYGFTRKNEWQRYDVVIEKYDSETDKLIVNSDATFKIKDKETGEFITLVNADESQSWSEFTTKNGIIKLPVGLPQGEYELVETAVPEGYTADTPSISFTVNENTVDENNTLTIKVENTPLKGTISVSKKGIVFTGTNTSESDFGTIYTPVFKNKYLSGVTFDVIADEDIITADGTKHYSKNDVVQTLTTRADASVKSKELPLGKYRVVETATLGGYKLDTTPHYVTVTNDGTSAVQNFTVKIINKRASSEIVAVKEAYQWKEISGVGDEVNREVVTVPGAGFTFGLYADEKFTSYDGSSTIEKDSLIAVVVSDEEGKVRFGGNLPFGNYYVKELAAPANNYVLSDMKYKVSTATDKTDGETIIVNVTDKPILNTFVYGEAKVKKVDLVTGNPVEGAKIEVKSETGAVIRCGYTDKNGELSFLVEPGNYTAYEKEAPKGYLLNTEEYNFTVTENDIKSQNVVEVKIENVPLRGKITVIKKAEQFVGFETSESKYGTVATPLFEVKPFAGATFTVTAAEDIYSPDGTLKHSKGDTVETLTTTNTGVVTTKELYPGKYNIAETATQGGYKLDSTVYEVNVTNDGKQAVVDYSKTLINERAEIDINAVKEAVVWKTIGEGERVTRITEIVPGAGFTFGLFTSEDISTYDGSEALKKNTLIEVVKSDDKGNIKFTANIPFGNYYIKELEAPEEHYIIPDTKYPVSAQTDKTDGATIKVNVTNDAILNDFTKHPVKITKTDLVTGEPVKGATVEIFDADGNVIYREITGADGTLPNVVLEPGKYTFRETLAPLGYICNPNEFEFIVNADGTVDGTVDFTNEPAKITVSKTDAVNHKPIPGTEITFYTASGDEVGPALCTYTTDENGQVTAMYLEVGQKYYFKETKAANGFAINKNLYTFVINEDGTITGDTSLEDDYTRFTINKINDKGEPLANVVFTMYDENGNPVDTATSDEAGIAQFVGFGVGKYTIKETATVKGYELAPDSIKIENDGSWDNDSELCSISVINNKIVLPPVIKTGDDTNIIPWIVAVSISGTIILAAVIIQLAKRKKTSPQ